MILFYSLENGKTHTIHIPAVDDDDDAIECHLSMYIEAGAFKTLVKNLTNTNIIMMSEKVLLFFAFLKKIKHF